MSAIEISKCGGYLISGYKGGQIALWDLVKYKLLKYVNEMHGSEVIQTKIYHVTPDEETVFALSSEDSGQVHQMEFQKKSFLGGYSHY